MNPDFIKWLTRVVISNSDASEQDKSQVTQALETLRNPKTNTNTVSGCINKVRSLCSMNTSTFSEKYVLDPNDDKLSWKYYKDQERAFWGANEIDYDKSRDCYLKLNSNLREALDYVNGWFLGGEGMIVSNLLFRFLLEARSLASVYAYVSQLKQELVHSEVYFKVVTGLVVDSDKIEVIKRMSDNVDAIKKKEELMEVYTMSDLPEGHRTLAFICSELIFFLSSFCLIFMLKSLGLMDTLADINKQIAGDETRHGKYGVDKYLALPLNVKPSVEVELNIIKEFVEVEVGFSKKIEELVEKSNIKIEKGTFTKFVRYMGNRVLVSLGRKEHYSKSEANCPSWMNTSSSFEKSNFYEVTPGGYGRSIDYSKKEIDELYKSEDFDF